MGVVNDAWLTLLQAAQQVSTEPWLEALKHCGSVDTLLSRAPRLLSEQVAGEALAKLAAPEFATLARWRAWLARPNRALVTYGSAE
jgi:hypothetical protein